MQQQQQPGVTSPSGQQAAVVAQQQQGMLTPQQRQVQQYAQQQQLMVSCLWVGIEVLRVRCLGCSAAARVCMPPRSLASLDIREGDRGTCGLLTC
jgi:hypothetical protein